MDDAMRIDTFVHQGVYRNGQRVKSKEHGSLEGFLCCQAGYFQDRRTTAGIVIRAVADLAFDRWDVIQMSTYQNVFAA
jgi:hypothetical protein